MLKVDDKLATSKIVFSKFTHTNPNHVVAWYGKLSSVKLQLDWSLMPLVVI